MSRNSVTTQINKKFTITRADNPSTGYTWSIMLSPNLTLVNSHHVGSPDGRPGAPGIQRWQIKSNQIGKSYITLWNHRVWDEPNLRNAEIVTVNTVV